jgi:hypothetical protein
MNKRERESLRKLAAVVLSASLVLGSVSTYSSVALAETTVSSDITVKQQAQLKAFNDLKALFSANPVDLAGVKSQYESKLQADVKAASAEIDEKITLTLAAAIDGKLNAGQAKQAIDKGLQWFFYSELTRLTKTVAKDALVAGNKAEAKAALDQAVALYNGALQGTAGKRDSYYKSLGVKTQDLLDTVVIPSLYADIEAGNVVEFNVHRQMLDKTLIKVFHLAALKYAVEAPKQADAEKAKAEVTEGYFFYMPINGSLSAGSAADAKFIHDAFASGDPSKLDAAKIKAAFAAALNGKISGYVEKTLNVDLAKGDVSKAQEHAMEGNMFLAAEEVLIKEKLGAAAYVQASEHAKMYYDAVAANDKAAAYTHAFAYLQIIAGLDGVKFAVGDSYVVANGEKVESKGISYINKQTSRTLVPIRVVEQLGADVQYVAATKTVIINKDGVKTELVVGSTDVLQNGTVNEKIELDQAVEVKDARSFIPLRAVAELFGNKVFYLKGEIVIVK